MHLEEEVPPPVSNEGFCRLQVRYSEDSSVVRHLFAKQFSLMYHKPISSTKTAIKSNQKPENRTLLLVNVPPFVNEHHLRHLFSERRCGCRLERIFLQEKPSAGRLASLYNQIQLLKGGDEAEGEAMETDDQPVKSVTSLFGDDEQQHIGHYKVAYVVFQSPKGLERALAMAASNEVFSLKSTAENGDDQSSNHFSTGIRLWQRQYNNSVVMPPWQAKKVAEAYLADYHRRAEEEAAREKRLVERRGAGKPDAEGWTTVNRKVNRRDKAALVSSQFFDRKIMEKYDDRAKKRQQEEAAFEEAVSHSNMLDTGKRKKRKGGRFNAVDFLKDGGKSRLDAED